jgi:hypothetical protein
MSRRTPIEQADELACVTEQHPMSEQIHRRLEEVMSLLPCPVSGCWFVHGAETSYFFDTTCECHVLEVWPVGVEEPIKSETNGHEETKAEIFYELAEFDFTELIKAVPLDNFHFSQRRGIFEISWKEFGQDLELRVHIEPAEADQEP